MASAKDITDRIAKEENEADKKAFDSVTVEPLKRGVKAIYESVVGTPEQNKEATERMKARDAANPDSTLAKINKTLGFGGYDKPEAKKKGGKVCGMKKGGSVSSASKRADGCAVKGKTRGRVV